MTAESDVRESESSSVLNAVLPAAGPRWSARSILGGLIVLASHLPLLVAHFQNLGATDRYRYLLFVPVASAFIVGSRIGRDWGWDSARPWRWLALERVASGSANSQRWLFASCIVLAVAVLLWSPWLGAVASILAARSLFLRVGRKYRLDLTSAWLLLWLLIPLPLGADAELVNGLLTGVAHWGSRLSDFFGYSHLLVGQTIHTLSGRQVVADEACQGMRLVFELTAFTGLYVVWTRRPRMHAILLLLTAPYWGAAMAVFQLLLAVHTAFLDAGTLVGQWHDATAHFGPLILGVLMVLSTDRFLIFLFLPAPDLPGNPSPEPSVAEPSLASASKGRPVAVLQHRLTWAFGLLLVVQLAGHGVGLWTGGSRLGPPTLQAGSFTATTLPQETYGWERQGFSLPEATQTDSAHGSSAVWTYQKSGSQATVSCSLPHAVRRSPGSGYRSQGWDTLRRVADGSGDQPDADHNWVVLELRDRDCQPVLLFHSVLDGQGRVSKPPGMPGVSISWWLGRVRERLQRRAADFGYRAALYEFQVLVQGPAAFDSGEQHQLASAVVRWREMVAAALQKASE